MKRKSENALTNIIVQGKKHEKNMNQKVIHQNKRVNELS